MLTGTRKGRPDDPAGGGGASCGWPIGEVRCCVAGKQLGSGDHGVVEPVPAGYKSNRAAEVVDEDVGVDEKISHAATRRARAQSQTVRHQMWP